MSSESRANFAFKISVWWSHFLILDFHAQTQMFFFFFFQQIEKQISTQTVKNNKLSLFLFVFLIWTPKDFSAKMLGFFSIKYIATQTT